MTNFLKETYGGSEISLFEDRGYCCYIVYDMERDMYYSGMKSYKGPSHPIGKTYFTSSTVMDFKNRFIKNPELFQIKVEYFSSLKEMSEAEKRFHHKINVSKNTKFYNAINSAGSTCGSGSLLCKNENDEIYRISVHEYKNGLHNHVCKNRMLVYINGSDKLTSINRDDFDPNTMKTQFEDHVLCYDSKTQENRRIPREVFLSDKNRYQGITKGKCIGYNKKTGEKVVLETSNYSSEDYYFKCSSKTVKVINKITNEIATIPTEEYRQNKNLYKHINSLYLVRIDLLHMIKRKVLREEYDKFPNHFADLNAKEYYVIGNNIFGSWKKLANHLGIKLFTKKDKVIKDYNIEVRKICVQNLSKSKI